MTSKKTSRSSVKCESKPSETRSTSVASTKKIHHQNPISPNHSVQTCYICHCRDFCETDSGLSYCQNCLYRKCLFLKGANLECNQCEVGLTEINFEFWIGKTWCKNCIWRKFMNGNLVSID